MSFINTTLRAIHSTLDNRIMGYFWPLQICGESWLKLMVHLPCTNEMRAHYIAVGRRYFDYASISFTFYGIVFNIALHE